MTDTTQSLEALKRAALLRLLKQRGAQPEQIKAQASIPQADRTAPLPLSFAQQRLWFLDQLDPTASVAYHMPAALALRGELDRDALKAALNQLVARHESLRTTFARDGEQTVQVIAAADSGFSLSEHDLRHLPAAEARAEAERLAEEEARAPLVLSEGPLVRGRLLRLADHEHRLLLTQHHIISDGWSTGVLVKELAALYQALSSGQAPALPDLPLQYADYAAWQRTQLSGETLAEQVNFWRDRLAGAPALLNLPTDRPRPAVQSFRGDTQVFDLPPALAGAIQQQAQARAATPFMLLMAAWAVLLARVSGQQDVVIGTVAANRDRPEWQGVIGFFVNTLAIRVRLEADPTLAEVLEQVKALMLEAADYQGAPFDQVVEALNPPRSASHSPVFQSMLYTNAGGAGASLQLPGLELEFLPSHKASTQHDLSLHIDEGHGQLSCSLSYATALFEAASIERLGQRFENLLEHFTQAPDTRLSRLELDRETPLPAIEALPEHPAQMPLSFHQERLWFIDTFEAGYLYPANPVYHNIPLLLALDGEVDQTALRQALNGLLERHALLRCRIHGDGARGWQTFAGASQLPLTLIQADAHALFEQALAETRKPLPLGDSSLVRACLVQADERQAVLALTVHHLLADRTSMSVLRRDLLALYAAACAGREADLPALDHSFADFAVWQRQLPAAVTENLRAWWAYQLRGKLQALELPLIRPRAAVHVFAEATHDFRVEPALVRRLQGLAEQTGYSTQSLALSAFSALLRRYAGHDELVVGTSAACRNEALAGVVGPIDNLLVIRSQCPAGTTPQALCASTAETLAQALAHRQLQFDQLVLALNPAKDMSRTALFDVLFNYKQAEPSEVVAGVSFTPLETNLGYGKNDLHLLIDDHGLHWNGHLVYNAEFFEPAFAEQLMQHYVRLLEALVDAAQTPVDDLPLLSAEQRQQQVLAFNDSEAAWPEHMTIHQLFEEQVRQCPERIAVNLGNERLSYAQLNAQANQLAHRLRAAGVTPQAPVAIALQRSLGMVVATLAVLKAGGAYVPVDPNAPAERIAFVLQDSGVRHAIADPALAETTARLGIQVLALQDDSASPAGSENLPNLSAPDHLAYVIYTSGSTGQPKGALLEHRNVVRLLHNSRAPFDFGANDVWSLFHSHAFDFSVWEMFGALLHGGRLALVPEALRRDPQGLLDFLQAEQVSVLNQTPSAFDALSSVAVDHPASLEHLRYVIFGGESLEPARLAGFHQRFAHVALVNMYGITETCVHVTFKALQQADIDAGISNVGRPIPTTEVYVLDDQQRLLPVGVAGEICVAGLGVGRGYLNRPELTAERFIDNPLRPGQRLYRSGDLGKWLANGELVHLGRMDAQVKIRGFRIELGEIEAKLLACQGVREARVLARDDAAQGKRLVAYLIPQPGTTLAVAALRAQLGATLPDYMIPSAFVSLASYPLTVNGKLDTQALPATDLNAMASESYAEPEGPTEQALAELYEELLGVSPVGRNDSFFELGGHSLLAAQLVVRVRQQLGHELMLRDLFSNPSVAALAQVLGVTQASTQQVILPADRSAPLPLSFAQQRLWFLDRLDPAASAAYHMRATLLLRGELDRGALQAALDRLVVRHESLRTTFSCPGEQPVQVIAAADIGFSLSEQDLRALPYEQASQSAARIADHEAAKPFDLSSGPLIRGHLLRVADDEHVLLVVQHHIISDGWSVGICVRELGALYRAFSQRQPDPLPPLAIQYADYAAWQHRTLSHEQLQAQAAYWREHLQGAPAVINLPSDRPRPARQSFRGGDVPVLIEAPLYQRLANVCKQHQVTPFMALLSAWAVLMARLGNEPDVVIGVPNANRSRAETEALIGFFVNTQALRLNLADNPSGAQLLDLAKQAVLGAHEHQDIPFEQVIEALQPPRSLSHSPVCQVALSLDNTPGQADLALPGLSLTPVEQAHHTAQFELMLTLGHADGGLAGVIEYASDLFERGTVERFAEHFKVLLTALLDDLQRPVLNLPLLSAAQRQASPASAQPKARFAGTPLLHQRFERAAADAPHSIALSFAEQQVSYQALNRRANALAEQLLSQGVQPDQRVAILAERGIGQVVAILAVLKAGAGYVPLDPAYPAERLGYLLDDSQPTLLLAEPACLSVLPDHDVPVLALDISAEEPGPAYDHNPELPNLQARHLAYVIYTSGSTGQPKGVQVEHRQVARLFDACAELFDFSAQDVWTLFHSFAFDFSVWELWGALSHGGRLVIVPAEVARSAEDFHALVCRERVTILNQTPSAFRRFIQAHERAPGEHSLREVIFGGEALEFASLRPWIARTPLNRTRLVNMYGITEITVHATFYPLAQHEIDEGAPSLIGIPLPDLCLRVLDANLQPVPVGVEGEIYIGGGGVARGYLNRDVLNAERFIDDPFAPGERLYRTGDTARYNSDGGVVYVGRNDSQVKIRGLRIELGEIEARLLACPGVSQARVLAFEYAPGDQRLVAYLIPHDGAVLDAARLREQLAEHLMDYMLPSAFVSLQAWPLTTNGKLDRKALPAPDSGTLARREYQAPQGPVETLLAQAWQSLLRVEQVGREDHFFELGGHSFLVISLIERLRQEGLALDVRTVFAAPTLKAMAAATVPVDAQQAAATSAIPADCQHITPDMLPLASLSQAEIEQIVEQVPGGAANVQDIYPLSPLQEGILFHHLLQSEGDAYLMRTVVTFERRELLDNFLAAVQVVIDRHDILRSALRWQGLPAPVQVVQRQARLLLVTLDCPPGESALEVLREHTDPHRLRLDLQQAPLIAAYAIYDEPDQQWLLALLDHHLISDNVTLRLIMLEIQAVLDGRVEQLPPSQPYRDFIAKNAQVPVAEHEAYFRRLLHDVDSTSAPFGVLDVHGSGAGIQRAVRHLSPALTQRVHQVASAQGVPTSVLFHAAWGLVVAATSGSDEGLFGTVLSGRSQGTAGADHALGMFINTLPMRLRVRQHSVAQLVADAYQQLSELLVHEQAPLALAQRCSAVEASAPLFTVILNCRHGELIDADGQQREQLADQPGIRFLASETRTNYPLEIAVADVGEQFSLTAQAVSGIDPARVAQYLEQAVSSLVDALQHDPTRPAQSLEVLPDAEREQLLHGFNHTAEDFGAVRPLHVQFEQQAEQQPDATALVHEQQQLSYRQLNRRANHLARQLLALGVQPDDRVALCAERSLEMIVGVLAVLKAGAAYVPLDPANPTERMAFLLADSQPCAVLAQAALTLPPVSVPRLALDSAESLAAADDPGYDSNPHVPNLSPEHLAYVIYTSGSTGQAKGVMVEHRSLFNFSQVLARTTHSHCSAQARVALNAGFYFDMSLKGICQLGAGHCLVIVPQHLRASGQELLDFLEAEQIQAFDSTPSQLDGLLAAGLLERERYKPRSVLLGGEPINAATWARLRACPSIHFYNMYGPTEGTVDASQGRIADLGEQPSIGRPLANVQLYVLDALGQPAPIGVAGELHIGGIGVARGYLNRPELTAERFIHTPLGRLYKTGDLGRWRADGTLEYLGRNDFQVKIRGFRIELGEIESALLACDGVREAAVIARNDSHGDEAGTRLVAYLCGTPPDAGQLRAALLERLPEYMVPSAYVVLEQLPLTANGKLDRRALPAPGAESLASQAYVAPQGETEQAIAQIWQALLGVEQVGRDDGFLELGGHSLLAVQLLSRLRRKLGARISLRELFEAPTVRGLAALVDGTSSNDAGSIPLANRNQRLPLSFAQQRLWFLDQLDPAAGAAYHLPQALRLSGPLDRRALQATLDRLVARHEILRTRFERVDGEPAQAIAPADCGFSLAYEDLRGLPEAERESALQALGEANVTQLFDMARGPLLRGLLAQVDEQEHVLFITLHHIISDGWSNSVLASEVSRLYSAFVQGQPDPLPPLPLQYADYAAWQRRVLDAAGLEASLNFWRQYLDGAPALLDLPLDRPRPATQSYAGGIVECRFPVELSTQLRQFSQAQGSTLFMLLLAGWSALMSHLSGQQDVVVGTPVANRSRPELEPLIGFFTNTLALRVKPCGETPVNDLLAQVKAATLAAYQHQDLPFEQVVSALQPVRNMGHNPLFQVMLSLNNTPDAPLQLPGLRVAGVERPHHATQFDLALSLVDHGDFIGGSLQYASDLFDTASAERIAALFGTLLEHWVRDADQPLRQVLAQLPVPVRKVHSDEPALQAAAQPKPFEAPQGPVEQAVAAIWRSLFNKEQISRHDDFFQLGGISLMAVQMTSRLRKVLGKPVAVRDLFVEPTLAGFARTLSGEAGQGQASNLVPVRPRGERRPLFLVHPLGGEVQYAYDLAAALPDSLPVYGLAASGMKADESVLSDVPAMASRYLAAIRQVQGRGPYRIAGWSAGGLIAYEMARQLQASGERLEFLGIIDASARTEAEAGPAPSEAQFLMAWLPQSIPEDLHQRLQSLAEDNAVEPMLALCSEYGLLPEELPAGIDLALLRSHLAVAWGIRKAVGAYVTPPSTLSLKLFSAADQPRQDPTLGWTQVVGEQVQAVALPGTHNSLVKAPYVQALGEAIDKVLQEA